VKDNENQHKKLHADGNITSKNPLNNTVQQDAKIYYYCTITFGENLKIGRETIVAYFKIQL
jgi:hypothetical protein